MKRARAAVLVCALSMVWLAACRRSSTGGAGETGTTSDPATLPTESEELPMADRADGREVPPQEPAHPSTLNLVEQTGDAASPSLSADPFESAIDETRRGAVACFRPLAAAEYAATLVMTVSRGGMVTRAEVEPGNVEDNGVLRCLQAFAEERAFPASNDGRTLRVQVRVRR